MQKSIKKISVCILAFLLLISINVALVFVGSANDERKTAQEKSADEFIRVASLFSAENGVSVKTNQPTPAYVEEARNGVLVGSKNGKRVSYEKAIDISDNTKDDLLFELQITPNESGTMELQQFLIRFEDWENPNNYFEISLYNYPWGQSANGIVSVKTNTVTQYRSTSYKVASVKDEEGTVVDYKVDASNTTDTTHGTVVECSFDGRNATAYHTVTNSVKFYYDGDEKAVYVGNVYDWSGALAEKGYDTNGKIKVLDMDLQSDMGSTKSCIWEGFESKFVRASIVTSEMEADVANYMILTIDNQTMSGDIVNDTTPPRIEVDVDEENLPYGVVGQKFVFSDAVCYDEMYETNTTVTKQAYFNGGRIQSSENGFIPEQEGKYVVKYFGFDLVGNKAEKIVEIDVLAAAKPVSLTIDERSVSKGAIALNADEAVNVELFAKVRLPEVLASGASGKTKTEIIVKHDGNFVDVNENIFIPFDEGKYVVTYKITDSISNVYFFDYEVNASYSGKAIVEDVLVEEYMLDGCNYKIPKIPYSLINEYGEKIENAKATIKVLNADTNGVISTFDGKKDALFTAKKSLGERIKIVYEVEYDGLISVKEKTVRVLTNECLGDKFVTDSGVTRTINEYSLAFSTTENGKGFAFANQVLIEELSLRFAIPKTQNDFEKLHIYINDFETKTEEVKLTLLKNADSAVTVTDVLANGEYLGECRGNFHETASMDFILTFDGNRIYDSNDDLIGKLTETVDGEAFEGFTSKFVNIRFEFEGVSGESAISFTYINNQMMGDFPNTDDYMAPNIYVEDEIEAQYTVGDKLIVPKVYVYDVFDSVPKTTVSLIDGENDVCFEEEFLFGQTEVLEYVFTSYGEYMLNITVEDTSGNVYTYMGGIAMVVSYNVKPIIHVAGEIKGSATVNEKVELPKITVFDIKDGVIDYEVYVYSPSGDMTKIEDSFVPTSKGEYSVFIYAVNSSGNVAVSDTYVITVR